MNGQGLHKNFFFKKGENLDKRAKRNAEKKITTINSATSYDWWKGTKLSVMAFFKDNKDHARVRNVIYKNAKLAKVPI